MRKKLFLILSAVLLVGACSSDQDVCWTDPSSKKRIEACTRMINNPKLDAEAKAFAYRARGGVYFADGDTGQAIADLTESIRIAPDWVTYVSRAQIYHATKQFDLAIADYKKATKPGDLFEMELAQVYVDKGDYDAAIAIYTGWIEQSPQGGYGHIRRARIYLLKGDKERARADFKAAAELGHPFAADELKKAGLQE